MFGSVSREPKDHKHKIKGFNKPIHVQISNPAAQAQPPMPIPAENPAPNPAPIPAQEDLPPVPHHLVLPRLAPVHADEDLHGFVLDFYDGNLYKDPKSGSGSF